MDLRKLDTGHAAVLKDLKGNTYRRIEWNRAAGARVEWKRQKAGTIEWENILPVSDKELFNELEEQYHEET